MEGLFSGQLAEAATASVIIKALISGVKVLFPSVGTPSTFTPLALRLAALAAGVLCGLMLEIPLLTLPATAWIGWTYLNYALSGFVMGMGALGTHEVVDMVKPQ